MNIWQRAQSCIAQGALTNSKHPKMLIYGLYPSHIKYGHGSYLYDEHDNKYLDFICGLGANFVGYGNDLLNRELQKTLYGGYSHSLPTFHEVECAEALKSIFIFVDRWKFLKTGGDACLAAVRIARASSKKTLLLSEGYHGFGDMFTSLVPPHKGVPDDPNVEKLDPLLSEEQISRAAAVIVEPVITDDGRERIEWLKKLRELCTKHETVLIFDEVITGFRYKNFGVSNSYGITPDLVCIGKAMANGMPLAAVGGKAALMDDPEYFISSTYAGEVLSLVACKKVLELLTKNPDYDIKRLWSMGEEFKNSFNKIMHDVKIEGYGTRGIFTGEPEKIALFFQEMAKVNILFCKSWFYNFGHIPHQDNVLDCISTVADKMRAGTVKLEYPLPQSPFSMGVRNVRS
jgi:glutamate-1-semialdehyde aminotransferase